MEFPQTVPSALIAALEAKGYEALTDVQAAVLTDEAEGRDLLVSAQTGSGKTHSVIGAVDDEAEAADAGAGALAPAVINTV